MNVRSAAVLLALLAIPLPGGGDAATSSLPELPAPVPAPAPVIREARYKMSAAVRPLLIFWIRASNVGGAQILWRGDGNGRRGHELLLGSDPRRAPRKINRWGWEREDVDPSGATLFGLMRKTDEDSLDEARHELGQEGQGGYVFKAIRSRLVGGEVRAENTLWRVSQDYGYRDIGELLTVVGAPPANPPRVREARVPPETRPGFLFAVADLVDEAVAAARRQPRQLPAGRANLFTFNATLFDLTLREAEWIETATYGGRRYDHLVRLDFEQFNRDKKTRERFTLVCATDGPLSGVPVFVEYQPKWWFKASGVLDESEVFPAVP